MNASRNFMKHTLLFILTVILLGTIAEGSNRSSQVINASDVLAKIESGTPVEYDNVVIAGDLVLSRLVFPGDPARLHEYIAITPDEMEYLGVRENPQATKILTPVSIKNSIIDGKLFLNNTIFFETVDFKNTKFNNTVDFNLSRFNEYADFTGSEFNGSASIRLSKFNNIADFTNTKFNRPVFFELSKFNGPAYFRSSRFNGIADFKYSKFEQYTTFRRSQFNKSVDFRFPNFNGSTYFEYSRFNGSVFFGLSRFNGPISFEEAIFNDDADFSNPYFEKYSLIRGAQFNNDVDFTYSKFNGPANFDYSVFNGDVSFVASEFNDDASFGGAKFYKKLDIWLIKFKNIKIEWNNIKTIFCDDQNKLKLIKNFKDLGQFEDADNVYYAYRRSIQDQRSWSWAKGIDIMAWISCGYGVRWQYTIITGLALTILFGFYYFIKGSFGKSNSCICPSFKESIFFSLTILTSSPTDWFGHFFDTNKYGILVKANKNSIFIERMIGWGLIIVLINTLSRVMIRY